jgi:flavorubredoxin
MSVSGMNIGDPITPREIADGVHWLGGCFKALSGGPGVHYHVSAYLVVGEEKALLADTGDPGHWDAIAAQLDGILGDRPLDYAFPTHPELPHAANLPNLFDRYPGLTVVGDVRDYHVHYPQMRDHLVALQPGDRLDLGGREVEFLPAIVLDLQNSLWALDTKTGTLFVSDGFSYIHELPEGLDPDGDEPPVHLAGQCELTSSELNGGPTVDQAVYGTARGLYWTRFVDLETTYEEVLALVDERGVQIAAPAHGNVVTDIARVLEVMAGANRRIYEG